MEFEITEEHDGSTGVDAEVRRGIREADPPDVGRRDWEPLALALRDRGQAPPRLDALQWRPIPTRIGDPHFFYHVSSAYAILRNQGVQLTMGDFLGDWGTS